MTLRRWGVFEIEKVAWERWRAKYNKKVLCAAQKR